MLLGMQQIGSSALSEFFLLSICARWPDHRAFSRISMPLSGEDGKGNLSWHVFLSGEATYARTEGKHNPVRKVLKHPILTQSSES
jgi:hypothetical protein